MDWKIWYSGYGHFLIRDKKWVIIIFKDERIFSLVGSDFVGNSFYIESGMVSNISDSNTTNRLKKKVRYTYMDMCYDGALVLPSSYAVMDEEEMCYTEGGGIKVKTFAVLFDVGVCILPVIGELSQSFKCGRTVKIACNLLGITKAFLRNSLITICKHAGATLTKTMANSIVNIIWACSGGSLGMCIGNFIDRRDSHKNNGIVFG